MTDTNNNVSNNQVDEADSKADAIAIFSIIMVAVGAMVYFVS